MARKEFPIPSGTIKEYYSHPHQVAIKFQFLLVRLKALTKSGNVITANKFQFLLVRLKRATCIKPCGACRISIPSGTIKSILKHKIMAKKYISIPSGTIKRMHKRPTR